jgi:hypothetical protein
MILYLNRASYGGQGTRELNERAITRCLDQKSWRERLGSINSRLSRSNSA